MDFPEYITHIPSVDNDFESLSSDVYVIKGERYNYLYDVGNNEKVAKALEKIPNKIAVISHFHHDHILNLDRISTEEVIEGRLTKEYTKRGSVLEGERTINDGVTIRLYYLKNSHAKDFIVLEAGDFLFLSDSVYCTVKNGRRVYNASLLNEQIKTLEKSPAKFFVVSHDKKQIYAKDEIIDRLKDIYSRRNPQNPYIDEKPAGD
ncbi:MAG: MBL fold metallo-hydrolase [Eubacterium sp.]|nr:MBL fold metallo-hydrolase [Eubacterium sp.]